MISDGMIRVFPRQTSATPIDEYVRIGGPHLWDNGDGQSVLISCAFIWDKLRCEQLAEQWRAAGYEPLLGGPAYDDPGAEFTPGMFVKHGLTITSRGCNGDCWFCTVAEREGPIRELAINDGFNILDNNLLQCSIKHVKAVFKMLDRQKEAAKFTGGLDAAAMTPAHVKFITELKRKPEILYFAYDINEDKEPLIQAARWMNTIGFRNRRVGCYVLVGYPRDTVEEATKRVQLCIDLDMMPYAMYYNNEKKKLLREWKEFQFRYIRPQQVRKFHNGQFGRFFR